MIKVGKMMGKRREDRCGEGQGAQVKCAVFGMVANREPVKGKGSPVKFSALGTQDSSHKSPVSGLLNREPSHRPSTAPTPCSSRISLSARTGTVKVGMATVVVICNVKHDRSTVSLTLSSQQCRF